MIYDISNSGSIEIVTETITSVVLLVFTVNPPVGPATEVRTGSGNRTGAPDVPNGTIRRRLRPEA